MLRRFIFTFLLSLSFFSHLILAQTSELKKGCFGSIHEGGQVLLDRDCGKSLSLNGIASTCFAKTKLQLEDENGQIITDADLSNVPATLFFGKLNKANPNKTQLISTKTVFSQADGTVLFKNVPCFTKQQYEQGDYVSGFIYNSENRPEYNPLFKRKETKWDAVEKDQFKAFYLGNRKGDTFIDRDVTKILLTGERLSQLRGLMLRVKASTIDQPECRKDRLQEISPMGDDVLKAFLFTADEINLNYLENKLLPSKKDENEWLLKLARKKPITVNIESTNAFLRFKSKGEINNKFMAQIDLSKPQPLDLCLVKNRSLVEVKDQLKQPLANFKGRRDLLKIIDGPREMKSQLQLEQHEEGFFVSSPFFTSGQSKFILQIKGDLFSTKRSVDWQGDLVVSHIGKGIHLGTGPFSGVAKIDVKTKSNINREDQIPIATSDENKDIKIPGKPNPPIYISFSNLPSHEKINLTKENLKITIAERSVTTFSIKNSAINEVIVDFEGNYNDDLDVLVEIKGYNKFLFKQTKASFKKDRLLTKFIARPRVKINLKGLVKPLSDFDKLNFKLNLNGEEIEFIDFGLTKAGATMRLSEESIDDLELQKQSLWHLALKAKIKVLGYTSNMATIKADPLSESASYQLEFILMPKVKLIIDSDLDDKFADQLNESFLKEKLLVESNQKPVKFELLKKTAHLQFLLSLKESDTTILSGAQINLPKEIPLMAGKLLLEDVPDKDYIYWSKLAKKFVRYEVLVPLFVDGKIVQNEKEDAPNLNLFSHPLCLEIFDKNDKAWSEKFLFGWNGSKQKLKLALFSGAEKQNIADKKYFESSGDYFKVNKDNCGPYFFTAPPTIKSSNEIKPIEKLAFKMGGGEDDFRVTFNGNEGIYVQTKPKFRFEIVTKKEGLVYNFAGIEKSKDSLDSKVNTPNANKNAEKTEYAYPPYRLCRVVSEKETCKSLSSEFIPGFVPPLKPPTSGETANIFSIYSGKNEDLNKAGRTVDLDKEKEILLAMQFQPEKGKKSAITKTFRLVKDPDYGIWQLTEGGTILSIGKPDSPQKDWSTVPALDFQKETKKRITQGGGTKKCPGTGSIFKTIKQRPNHESDRFYWDAYRLLMGENRSQPYFPRTDKEEKALKFLRTKQTGLKYTLLYGPNDLGSGFAFYTTKPYKNGKVNHKRGFCSWWQMAKHEGCPMISLFTIMSRQGKYDLTPRDFVKFYMDRYLSNATSMQDSNGSGRPRRLQQGMSHNMLEGKEEKVFEASRNGNTITVKKHFKEKFKKALQAARQDGKTMFMMRSINTKIAGFHVMPVYMKGGQFTIMDFNDPKNRRRIINSRGIYAPNSKSEKKFSTWEEYLGDNKNITKRGKKEGSKIKFFKISN